MPVKRAPVLSANGHGTTGAMWAPYVARWQAGWHWSGWSLPGTEGRRRRVVPLRAAARQERYPAGSPGTWSSSLQGDPYGLLAALAGDFPSFHHLAW